MHRTPARRRLVVALFLGATLAAVELISRAGLSVLERRGVEYRPLVVDRLSAEHRGLLEDLLAGRPSLFQHDAVLGWTLRPGFRSELCTIGLDGRRRDSERPEPIAPAVRVAAFGDSFIFGGDVADRYAIPEVLARLDAGLEVENFGVPAYGLDQAFLRYQREGRPASTGSGLAPTGPQVVVIGYMAENIFRNVSMFRPSGPPLEPQGRIRARPLVASERPEAYGAGSVYGWQSLAQSSAAKQALL